MTDDDLRRRLDELTRQLDSISDRMNRRDGQMDHISLRVEEIDARSTRTFRELFELPPGASATDKTLIQRVKDGLQTIDRLKWLTRAASWFVALMAGVSAVLKLMWQQILDVFK